MFTWFITLFKTNPVFVGMFGAMISGSILWLCKALPNKILNLLVKYFTVSVTINNDDSVYAWVDEFISNGKFSVKARVLKVFTKQSNMCFAPGYGDHLFWYDRSFIRITRLEDTASGTVSWNKKEKIKLSVLGRRQDKIRKFFKAVEDHKNRDQNINVYSLGEKQWDFITTRSKRSFDGLFLDALIKNDLLSDVNWFNANRNWYTERSIPYRRGYILYGPPGTGKSSIAFCLASLLERSVFMVSLDVPSADVNLLAAINKVPKNSILLLEDVDAFNTSERGGNATDKNGKEYSPISLSSLLNALDGVGSPENIIIIMTSNHIDKLDSALLRPGRIDKKFFIDRMKPAQVIEMFTTFYPDHKSFVEELESYITLVNLTPAEWQSVFLDCQGNMVTLFNLLATKVNTPLPSSNGTNGVHAQS